jgi:NAD(P)H-hydrate epimerase
MPAPAAPPPVGIDVASVTRLRTAVERNPGLARRAYTDAEIRDCERSPRRWASRWAAKEAVRKLAGSGGLGPRRSPLPAFRDVEVAYDEHGAPMLRLPGGAAAAVSISNEGDLVVAVAVAAPPGSDPLDQPPSLPAPAGLRLPPRSPDAHKGDFGTVTVLAGAHGFSGAAYLAGTGAARGGAGRVRLCVPQSLFAIIAVKCTEVMTHGLPDGGAGTVGEDSVAVLERDHLPASDVLVAGCGLGQAPRTVTALAALLERLPCPTVVDADGLNIAAARHVEWRRSGQPLVLTPHPAEMGRLLGTSAREVQADREAIARRYAAEHGVVLVLKGARTVIAAPDGRLAVDGHRVVALASGGTGDVLAGLIGAMLAGGLEPFDAAVAGVTVHAEAGAAVEATRGRAGALASDVLDALPAAQERLRRALAAAAA